MARNALADIAYELANAAAALALVGFVLAICFAVR